MPETEFEKRLRQYADATAAVHASIPGAMQNAGQDLIAGMQQTTDAILGGMQQNNQQMQQAGEQFAGSFGEFLNQKQAERDQVQQQYQQAQEKNQKAIVTGGIMDFLANIANTVGAIHGATPMQWQSPVAGWQQKADQIRMEGEQRQQQIDRDILALQQQQAQARYNARMQALQNNSALLNTEASRADQMAKTKYEVQSGVAKAETDAALAGLNAGMQTEQAIQQQRNSDRAFEQQQRNSDRSFGLQQRQQQIQEAMYGGLDKDGKFVPGQYNPKGASTTGGASGKDIILNAGTTDAPVRVTMNSDTLDNLLRTHYFDIKAVLDKDEVSKFDFEMNEAKTAEAKAAVASMYASKHPDYKKWLTNVGNVVGWSYAQEETVQEGVVGASDSLAAKAAALRKK